jgi:alkylation response protein AidB-like acyl-CoA dehydrogenase
MDLSYDTEQVILRDSAEKFLSSRCSYALYRKLADGEGWSPELWSEFAGLGWLGLPFGEEDGGVGAGAVEVAILMEAFAKHLVLAPYLSGIVLGGGIVAKLADADQRQVLLGPVIEGKSRLAFAVTDRAAPTAAKKTASGFVVSGAKKMVLGAPMADTLLVSAKIGTGMGVFSVPVEANGVTLRGYRTVDGGRAADIELNDVAVPARSLLGGNEDAADTIDEIIDRGIAALSADAVGAMTTLVGATVDYTKTRIQFGQPLAKFQVLQHRMVGMKVKEEEARASCLFATLSLDGPAFRRARACSGAKAKIGRMARAVGQEAIQLHGAIGTTDELPIGGYVKRLMAYEILFGSTRDHLNRYAAMIANPDVAREGPLLEAAIEG